ncbi:MAG: hypothetical protein D4S01_08130 [Dehalococcoidia bacterium]|nr:MAG: hypothetical protein D4S01_08130 [Dehalococcoidia bacterium]
MRVSGERSFVKRDHSGIPQSLAEIAERLGFLYLELKINAVSEIFLCIVDEPTKRCRKINAMF